MVPGRLATCLGQPVAFSQRTGAPSPARRNGSSSSSQGWPSSSASSASREPPSAGCRGPCVSRSAPSSASAAAAARARPGRGRQRHRRPQPALGHEHVAVPADDRAERAQRGRAAVADRVAAGTGILADFEPQHVPRRKRRGDRAGRAGLALPQQLAANRARRGGLIDPVQAHRNANNPGHCPLNVRAQRRGRTMHVQHASNGHQTSLPADEIRLPQRSRRSQLSDRAVISAAARSHCAVRFRRAPAPGSRRAGRVALAPSGPRRPGVIRERRGVIPRGKTGGSGLGSRSRPLLAC